MRLPLSLQEAIPLLPPEEQAALLAGSATARTLELLTNQMGRYDKESVYSVMNELIRTPDAEARQALKEIEDVLKYQRSQLNSSIPLCIMDMISDLVLRLQPCPAAIGEIRALEKKHLRIRAVRMILSSLRHHFNSNERRERVLEIRQVWGHEFDELLHHVCWNENVNPSGMRQRVLALQCIIEMALDGDPSGIELNEEDRQRLYWVMREGHDRHQKLKRLVDRHGLMKSGTPTETIEQGMRKLEQTIPWNYVPPQDVRMVHRFMGLIHDDQADPQVMSAPWGVELLIRRIEQDLQERP